MTFAKTIISHLVLILTLLSLPCTAGAFPTETYASQSVLAGGNWVKVSVKESGIHFLSAAELRRMGFSDPAAVRVYGYGAVRLPDRLDPETYVDDLPQVQTLSNDRGLWFYATGPVDCTEAATAGQLTFRTNPFTSTGYYFLTDNAETEQRAVGNGATLSGLPTADSFTEALYHNRDILNPGETGNIMLGEDFLSQASQTFTFTLTDRVEGTRGWLECSFWANSKTSSRIVLSVNDNALPYSSSDNIEANTGVNAHYYHGRIATTRKTFDLEGDRARITINHSRTGTASLARLDYLVVNYERRLALPSAGSLDFHLNGTGGELAGASASTRLWDVTDPLDIRSIEGTLSGTTLTWQPVATGMRHYAAWHEGGTYPSPVMVGRVANQNLHAQEVPDMVIFTHADWLSQAERVADLHRNDTIDPLNVLVVDARQVYNEFSSGSPDANALRRLLKMFWDRSTPDRRLRYAIIMGRSIYDNRRISSNAAALRYPTLPGWQTDLSNYDNTSYTTDDIYSMLRDGAGSRMNSDYQCIAVGRMPVTSLADARNVVDKLVAYVNSPINSGWKNRALMVADDGNSGVFMNHSETMIENAAKTAGGERIVWDKIYIDAYVKQNSTYPGARADMFRALTEGVVWWNFAGHANPTSWTGDGLMTYTDVNNLYLKHFPFVVAATCDFVRWDASSISAAEILYRAQSSGIIGAVSATRPAYIGDNGELLARMGRFMFAVDEQGNNLTIGEIFRRTKNGSDGNGTWDNDNKLRYVLMGDPAMRLCTPNSSVRLDAIDGTEPLPDNQATIMANQTVRLEGSVTDAAGSVLSDFNGKLNLTLYDAEYSTTSHGYDDGEQVTFEQQGKRLQAVVDSVRQGRFDVRMVMPGEISNNFRPATINMYAVADDGRDAVGVNRNFYVYGTDENAESDSEPPVIEAFYLNHPTFSSGNTVNTKPVVIARMSDNRSINLSSAGIGHQMLLSIDGRSLTDTPLYYTPYSDGTPGGTLVYELEELSAGNHSLRLRVWDTSGNSANAEIEFFADSDAVPQLYDLYADTNPARTDTRFYLTHDRPDALMTVNVEVFNMLGHLVWSTSVSGMSDTLRSFPVEWNLTDDAGRRLNRGIYLYRASITTTADGITSSTATRRLAITAP